MGFSPLATPFYIGGDAVTTGVPLPYHIGLGTHRFFVEPAKSSRVFIDQLRPSTDQSTEPGEQSVSTAGLWRRSQTSWEMGAGKTWLDTTPERRQFRASKGVDCWTPFELTILPDASTVKLAAAGTNLRLFSDPTNGKLWVVDGGNVKVCSNPSNASPTWSTCTGLPGNSITGATFTGAHLYVVANGVVYRCATSSTVFASWYSATTVSGLQYANGRLFAWQANEIFELTAGATKTTLFTHPQSSWLWDCVVAAPNATYMAGHLGYSSEIYRTDVRDATGALAAPVVSASIINERVTAMIEQGGYVILATKYSDGVGRIRLCQIITTLTSTGGALSVGPDMFTELGQRPAGSIDALHSIGRFIYFSWMNLDSTCTGCGRLDLQTFTQPLVPAYATDQMAGVSASHVQGAVLDVNWDAASSQLWFAVSGAGIYGTTAATLMDDAYLMTGRMRFGLLDGKVLAALDSRCLPTTGTGITFLVEDDNGSTLSTVGLDTASGGFSEPQVLAHDAIEWAELKIELTDDGAGNGPTLSWWVLEVLPTTSSIEQIVMAVMMRDYTYSGPGGDAMVYPVDVPTELDYLRSLRTSRAIVALVTGTGVMQVYVNNIQEQPERWSYDRRHWEGIVLVECKTLTS